MGPLTLISSYPESLLGLWGATGLASSCSTAQQHDDPQKLTKFLLLLRSGQQWWTLGNWLKVPKLWPITGRGLSSFFSIHLTKGAKGWTWCLNARHWCYNSVPLIQATVSDHPSLLQDFMWAGTGRREIVTETPHREVTWVMNLCFFLKLCCLLPKDIAGVALLLNYNISPTVLAEGQIWHYKRNGPDTASFLFTITSG